MKSALSDLIPQELTLVRLSPNIRLRPEYFGGLVFDTRNGNILEVDESMFLFLDSIKDHAMKIKDILALLINNGRVKSFDKVLTDTLKKLIELKVIETSDTCSSLHNYKTTNLPSRSWLSAPETVHWAVTYRCDENCPDCYVQRFDFNKDELSTDQAIKLIDKIADWKVFQLAIGGGEPFIRKDLPQLVRHAADRGLSVQITTGKLDIDSLLLESISRFVKVLQFGIRPDHFLNPPSTPAMYQLQEVLLKTQSFEITPGVNVFLTKSVIKRLENLIKILVEIGCYRIILLRYKPPKSVERWKAENPDNHQLETLHERIKNLLKENFQLNIRVDCALSFVQRQLPKNLATLHGIKGCVAADRILAVAPDGSVYPCSQLVHPDCYAGNLLESEPELLWDQSRLLRKYRAFRTNQTFKHSLCGVCQAKDICGGCRVFAVDKMGGDPGCPEPLLPQLIQISNISKGVDLTEYLTQFLERN